MAAFLRHGARRIVGSVLRRTQAAVTSPAVMDEQRRLATRRMSTVEHPPRPRSAAEIQQMKEELYDVLSKADNWRDMNLLRDLIWHVNPRPHAQQWRNLRVGRKIGNFAEITGTAVFVLLAYAYYSDPDLRDRAVRSMAMEKENRAKKRAVMERRSQVENPVERQA